MTSGSSNASSSHQAEDVENGPPSPAEAQPEGGEASNADETAADSQDDEADIGPALYPPILEKTEILGYVKDKNGVKYSRDIGRSLILHHEVYFIFGDTSSKNSAGESVETVSNTIAYVEDRAKCLESEYLEIMDDGKVKPFIPLNKEEIRFEAENKNARVRFRMIGGAVDTTIFGIVWFQVWVEYDNGRRTYLGIGYARLSAYSDSRLIVDRLDGLIFESDEPIMGSFSALDHNDHVYLWSHRGEGIILARVDRRETASRDHYEFWDGDEWVRHWQDAQPVLQDMAHGAVIYTRLFGNDRPFVLVGVNTRGDSMVQIGAAAAVQGPFETTAIYKATGIDNDNEHKHFIYPHLFASNIPKRELMVTWSEQLPGGVIAAKFKFKINAVVAVQEAEARRRRADEQRANRFSMMVAEQARRFAKLAEAEFRDMGLLETEEDDDPRPKRDRSEGRLKNGYVLRIVHSPPDPPPPAR